MIHAFLLIVILGDQTVSNDMYFKSIDRCNYFASQVVKRYGNYGNYDYIPKKHRATAYCKPVLVDESKMRIY